MNKYISIVLLLALTLFSGCTSTMPDGTIHDVGVLQKIGTYLYNPIFTEVEVEEQVGVNLVKKEKITGHRIVTVTNPDGTTDTIKEPIVEIVTFEEPIYKTVSKTIVTGWEPSVLGHGLKFLGSMIPVPGADEAAGAALAVGALGMGTQEVLRRRKKKITESEASDKDKEIEIAKAEKEAAEEHFHATVGGIKDFTKTEEGTAAKKILYEKIDEKAKEFGISRGFKTAISIAKAVL